MRAARLRAVFEGVYPGRGEWLDPRPFQEALGLWSYTDHDAHRAIFLIYAPDRVVAVRGEERELRELLPEYPAQGLLGAVVWEREGPDHRLIPFPLPSPTTSQDKEWLARVRRRVEDRLRKGRAEEVVAVALWLGVKLS